MALLVPDRVITESPAEICTSGRWNTGREIASTPTVPPVPRVPGLSLPTLAVCVLPSRRVLAPDTVVMVVASETTATPPVSWLAYDVLRPAAAVPSGIMKMLDSKPEGSDEVD